MSGEVVPLPCPNELPDVDGWHPCVLPKGHPGPCWAQRPAWDHPSHPDQIMARARGVCWHPPTSDRWPCTARSEAEPVASCTTSIQWLDDSPATPCVLPRGHDGSHRYEAVCGMRKPGSNSTCIEPAGHAGPDGKGESHGDGSVIRWIYR